MDAEPHLRGFSNREITLRHADGRAGLAEAAPFDRIMVTAATQDIEPAWIKQLTVGGLLLAPLAIAPGLAFVVCGGVRDGVFTGRLTRGAFFMPLRCEGEPGDTVGEGSPPRGSLQTWRAPWARWFDRRRPRSDWLAFIQALTFFGWLRGLEVAFRTTREVQPLFGLSDRRSGHGCWLGVRTWHATGETGRELAAGLWRAFLDAGGPWPTELRLSAVPRASAPRVQSSAGYRRCRPCCQQLWELTVPRERPGLV